MSSGSWYASAKKEMPIGNPKASPHGTGRDWPVKQPFLSLENHNKFSHTHRIPNGMLAPYLGKWKSLIFKGTYKIVWKSNLSHFVVQAGYSGLIRACSRQDAIGKSFWNELSPVSQSALTINMVFALLMSWGFSLGFWNAMVAVSAQDLASKRFKLIAERCRVRRPVTRIER